MFRLMRASIDAKCRAIDAEILRVRRPSLRCRTLMVFRHDGNLLALKSCRHKPCARQVAARYRPGAYCGDGIDNDADS